MENITKIQDLQLPSEIRGYELRAEYVYEATGNTFTNDSIATKLRLELGKTTVTNHAQDEVDAMIAEQNLWAENNDCHFPGAWGYDDVEWIMRKLELMSQAAKGGVTEWEPVVTHTVELYGFVAPDTRGLLNIDMQDELLTLEALLIEETISSEELSILRDSYAKDNGLTPTEKRAGIQYYSEGPYYPERRIMPGEAAKRLLINNLI